MNPPTLRELREFIKKHQIEGYWGNWSRAEDPPIARFFSGNCHFASVALAEYINVPSRQVVRGWYTHTIEVIDKENWVRNSFDHIGHTWLEVDNEIWDPTWWAFHPGEAAGIYVFDKDDHRYHTLTDGPFERVYR